MKTYTKWIGLAAIALAVLALALVAAPHALAQEPDPPPMPFGAQRGMARGGFGQGMGGGLLATSGYAEEMHAALADSLGMTVEAFEAEIAAGKTLWQIADEQGVAYEDIAAAKLGARAAALAQAVDDGVIEQEQATWMLERMQARFQYSAGAEGVAPQGFGPGMMRGGFGGRGAMGGGQNFGSCPYNPGTTGS